MSAAAAAVVGAEESLAHATIRNADVTAAMDTVKRCKRRCIVFSSMAVVETGREDRRSRRGTRNASVTAPLQTIARGTSRAIVTGRAIRPCRAGAAGKRRDRDARTR